MTDLSLQSHADTDAGAAGGVLAAVYMSKPSALQLPESANSAGSTLEVDDMQSGGAGAFCSNFDNML